MTDEEFVRYMAILHVKRVGPIYSRYEQRQIDDLRPHVRDIRYNRLRNRRAARVFTVAIKGLFPWMT